MNDTIIGHHLTHDESILLEIINSGKMPIQAFVAFNGKVLLLFFNYKDSGKTFDTIFIYGNVSYKEDFTWTSSVKLYCLKFFFF